MDERTHLDPLQAGLHESIDQLPFLDQRQAPGLALEPVAQGLVFEADMGSSQSHHPLSPNISWHLFDILYNLS
jgi:hypothetical protein